MATHQKPTPSTLPPLLLLLLLPSLSLGVGGDGPGEGGGPEKASVVSTGHCVRCCGSGTPPPIQLNLAILRGDVGEKGKHGVGGRRGRPGRTGVRGHIGTKGNHGEPGPPGMPCKPRYAAFSLGRRSPLHSANGSAASPLPFDSASIVTGGSVDLAAGSFTCAEAGVYHVTLTVHTWNARETYAHVMRNGNPTAVLYAQPSGRSVMQSQSLLLPLQVGDRVTRVRLHDGDRPNAIFGDDSDLYITFNGHMVQPLPS
ncbi:complement C1q tumor necrosis factor-related protein 8-like [Lethenteron reissneri]|uniref:complement C1q tumor necrosis factor-related protein 8-like n=1 Tax=Lethenteron reissneri TaxID=7753 RepID=UPI002AB72B9F|nr:complement C1q tumor necrosis factor-related protein 8-like [Lethenteron reissneri]